jgi:predicted O-methyltransferase YrrM
VRAVLPEQEVTGSNVEDADPPRSRRGEGDEQDGPSHRRLCFATVFDWRSPRSLIMRLWATRVLPRRVAAFQARALLRAWLRGDHVAFISSLRAPSLALLLRVADGRERVVELGTATAWTSCSLLLADPDRRVVSFDPVAHEHRDAYVRMLRPAARERLRLVTATGAEGAEHVSESVDLLFVDCGHEREMVISEVEAWRPRLAPGAVIVFDDYGHPLFPGVAEAIAELGLSGRAEAGCFVVAA